MVLYLQSAVSNLWFTDNQLAELIPMPLAWTWKLSEFRAGGDVTFVPHPHYSGAPNPELDTVEIVPFADDAPEFDDLTPRRHHSVSGRDRRLHHRRRERAARDGGRALLSATDLG